MFNDPTNGGGAADIPDGQYVIRLVRLEDYEPGQYGPRVKWVFNLWNAQSQQPVVYEDSGQPYEWWRLTSTKTGEKSTARKYMEALLNRQVVPGDSGAALAQEVIGKYALAMIATNEDGYPEIVNIKPYVQQAQAAPAAAAPAPAQAPAPPQQQAPAPAPAAAAATAAPGNPFAGVDPDSPF